MGLSDAVASIAMQMKNMDFAVKLNTSLMSKAMDTSEQLASGIIAMADDVPAFAGTPGYLLDVRA